MKFKSLLLAGCVALAPAAAVAGGNSLAGDELRSAVSGKTVYLRISGFELPIQYSAGGSMRGRMGSVAASFAGGESPTDTGKWWVKGDQLCQKWNSWMDGQSYCYRLTKTGSTVSWVRNDGRSGTARISG
ncbi:hypothetical protein A7A08_00457 [Methyloligella halotolerans]|uniref:Uncharacterized protein n=1 Tax=Methyloligella halotolerans TaxID=1177755 RepID=A0A1E2S2A1_9HYPH|nr:hypothetical protein [Methyloligella halotolerans]ODA68626.1 hypothetical protein A7A08_00457 [Methyloligella halotolerans]